MIKRLLVEEQETAKRIWELQIPSYEVEANLINFFEIPPLRETVEDLQKCGEIFYGLWMDDELAGAISYKREENTLDIHRMMVHPRHFRKGVASRLVEYVEQIEEGIEEILVSTGSKNTPAVNLYKRYGFEPIGELEIAPGVKLMNFRKRLEK
ncbi:GNAT family N-acetyltransferase [Brevibacillus ginsengisoli]|uniref:GNAT family N-acetyltransferase n=1 Tax=Brevibacillus ginsengisoli TaxID=363854 RepID=UPI003CEB7F97